LPTIFAFAHEASMEVVAQDRIELSTP